MNAASRSVRPNFIGMSSEELRDLVDFYQQRFEEQAILDGFRPIVVRDYESPYKPIGYDTVLGYLAKNDPVVLSLMDEGPEAHLEDEEIVHRACLIANMRRVEVDAPAVLLAHGIFTIFSYPVAILAAHFHP